MAFVSYAGAQVGLSSGKLRMLGISIFTTLGVIAPAGTPREIIAKTHADIMAALAIPEVAQRITEAGLTVIPGSSEQFGAVIRSEYEKFGQLVKMSGARRAD